MPPGRVRRVVVVVDVAVGVVVGVGVVRLLPGALHAAVALAPAAPCGTAGRAAGGQQSSLISP